MEFKEIKCLIPREKRTRDGMVIEPCGAYFCDLEANKETTLRFTCRQRHYNKRSNRIEFHQTADGVLSYREINAEAEKKGYNDNGVRFPATAEEVTE